MARLHADVARGRFEALDPVIDGHAMPSVSDDECLVLLAKAVEDHDPDSLGQVARLIGRLAVPIE